jgi:hypothetical protein
MKVFLLILTFIIFPNGFNSEIRYVNKITKEIDKSLEKHIQIQYLIDVNNQFYTTPIIITAYQKEKNKNLIKFEVTTNTLIFSKKIEYYFLYGKIMKIKENIDYYLYLDGNPTNKKIYQEIYIVKDINQFYFKKNGRWVDLDENNKIEVINTLLEELNTYILIYQKQIN